MENDYELYIKSIIIEQDEIEDEIYSINNEIENHFSIYIIEYESLSSEEKNNYKKNLIKLKRDSKKKEKLFSILSSIFYKRFIANVIVRYNEKISLENYKDICDNITLLFNEKMCPLENIEIKVKEVLLRNNIFNISDILDSIIDMFKNRGFTYSEELSL
jgi:hypothetical protein